MRYIEPYIHRCIVQSGPLAGNKNNHEVQPFEVEYMTDCDVCGGQLATTEQIVAHMYQQLTTIKE